MFLPLVDVLRCPVAHEETWLVASIDRAEDRDIITGALGCPQCLAEYPIRDGIVHFAADVRLPEYRAPDEAGAMRARGSGHIVTIGSIADRAIFPENAAYAASKFGVRALHEVLRTELRGSGVRTSLVSPGPVDTALWDEIDPDTRPGFTARANMLRSQDVASAVRYVVSAPASVNVDELRLSRA